MTIRTLARLELRIMEVLWDHGPLSVRELLNALPEKKRPAYTTIQTTIYRLEKKGAVRVAKKIGNANVFEATVTRDAAHRRIVDELLALLGDRVQPLMSQLIDSGRLTMKDIDDAKQALKSSQRPRKES